MASRLSQEEENYVRMSLLLTGISPRAARALFDHEFAPLCLDSSLKKEYNKLRDLKQNRVINQSQWNLLFPRFPARLSWSGAINNEKIEKSRRRFNRGVTSYISKIGCKSIKRLDFEYKHPALFDADGAISRLGGQGMKQECDNLKVKTLDQTNQEIMLDIKHSNDEIMKLKKSVERLKKANEDMTVELNELKTSHADTVPWNIRGEYLTVNNCYL
ncbi:unnamed protein product [Mytilus coruscus]|uniref:DZIP3-like HEPN domain-containing protein n=1 Tax=Mytilus coruscus TaxID=42192 RepID=A0A6J8C0B3_MYTCO|nr:unnamed protein product [Mytilus coruscus]